jgi:hypothetical protein
LLSDLRPKDRKAPAIVRPLKEVPMPSPVWFRAFVERLLIPPLSKEFFIFYGTLKFINVFTNARYLSLS